MQLKIMKQGTLEEGPHDGGFKLITEVADVNVSTNIPYRIVETREVHTLKPLTADSDIKEDTDVYTESKKAIFGKELIKLFEDSQPIEILDYRDIDKYGTSGVFIGGLAQHPNQQFGTDEKGNSKRVISGYCTRIRLDMQNGLVRFIYTDCHCFLTTDKGDTLERVSTSYLPKKKAA